SERSQTEVCTTETRMRFSRRVGLALVLTLAICSVTAGQTKPDASDDRAAIAIQGFNHQGGFLNFVSGDGRCICAREANAQSKQPLANGDTIELDDGHAELVLIPGYYLRLSAHTTALLLDLSRDNLKIAIAKG